MVSLIKNFKKILKYKVLRISERCFADTKFTMITILGVNIYVNRRALQIKTLWDDVFNKYFQKNDINEKIKNLKKNLDPISCEYIDKFIELIPFWNEYIKKDIQGWTNYDLKLLQKYSQSQFIQPFGYVVKFNPFIFQNKYGLVDLPKEVFDKINGKDIVDAGGLNGDTAVMFAQNFPLSKIYVYEPLIENIKTINVLIKEGNYQNQIIPVQKGLGNEHNVIDFKFNYENKAEIIPLDDDYYGDNLGLIKMDTEGFENAIVDGAKNLIKAHKPVLAIAMYHTPQDFFELKDKILALKPSYKFLIRRSEIILPTADLVLIAY